MSENYIYTIMTKRDNSNQIIIIRTRTTATATVGKQYEGTSSNGNLVKSISI